MGYTTSWGPNEIEEMLRRWHGHLKNAKTPSERANAREQILKLQEALKFKEAHKSDSRRKAKTSNIFGIKTKSNVWRM